MKQINGSIVKIILCRTLLNGKRLTNTSVWKQTRLIVLKNYNEKPKKISTLYLK